jgi:hypothetical protein
MGADYNDPKAAGAHGAPFDVDIPGGKTYAWVGFAEYGSLADITKVLSHEIVEAISDPEPNQGTRAWVMNRTINEGIEIGDACNNTFDVLDGVTSRYWSQALPRVIRSVTDTDLSLRATACSQECRNPADHQLRHAATQVPWPPHCA